MTEFGEREPKPIPEIAADFDAYAGENVVRFNGLSDFLTDSLGKIEGLAVCNAALEVAGRPDLAISERAQMMRIDEPEEVTEKCNNFTPSFVMHKDKIEPPEDSLERPTFIPITREEILAFRDLPKIESFDQLDGLEKSAEFPFPKNAYISHLVKPAFIRMLVLFPDFTADLVTRMSQNSARHRELRFEPELFVAYQIMSRLVDTQDLGAANSKAQAEGYLGR